MADDHDPSSEELARLAGTAIRGDTRAFTQLVERHRDHVVANCRYLSGSETQAEDLAQEVFVKVYRNVHKFEGRSRFRTWLQRVKINHCLSWIRRQRDEVHLDIDDPAVSAIPDRALSTPADKLERMSEQDRIRRTLASLPDNLRVALTLCDVDELSYAEIAESLDISLSAVKMRVKRAREAFRKEWARYDAIDERMGPSRAGPAVRAGKAT
ncbi:MAG: RNA polymerase sigma factor [Gemmatimonadetes bacterium]|nr:RNA polymerase sigma factor [Gemmatimonadota bacterium]